MDKCKTCKNKGTNFCASCLIFGGEQTYMGYEENTLFDKLDSNDINEVKRVLSMMDDAIVLEKMKMRIK